MRAIRRRESIVIGEEQVLGELDSGVRGGAAEAPTPVTASFETESAALVKGGRATGVDLREAVATAIDTIGRRAAEAESELTATARRAADVALVEESALAREELRRDLRTSASEAIAGIRDETEIARTRVATELAQIESQCARIGEMQERAERARAEGMSTAGEELSAKLGARLESELGSFREELDQLEAEIERVRDPGVAGPAAKASVVGALESDSQGHGEPDAGAKGEAVAPSPRRVGPKRLRALAPLALAGALGCAAVVGLIGGDQQGGLKSEPAPIAAGRDSDRHPTSQDRGSRRPKPARRVAPPDPERGEAPTVAPAAAPAPEAPPAPVTPPAPVSAPPPAPASAPPVEATDSSAADVQREFGP